jgi:sec-independent protein translocase protein TatB
VFDLSFWKLLVLAVIALVVFGPNELPKMAAQAGRVLRELRRIAEGAKSDLREGLGPEFQDFDFDDLNPKNFVRKHLLDDLEAGFSAPSAAASGSASASKPFTPRAGALTGPLTPGETPPYDIEAT